MKWTPRHARWIYRHRQAIYTIYVVVMLAAILTAQFLEAQGKLP